MWLNAEDMEVVRRFGKTDAEAKMLEGVGEATRKSVEDVRKMWAVGLNKADVGLG